MRRAAPGRRASRFSRSPPGSASACAQSWGGTSPDRRGTRATGRLASTLGPLALRRALARASQRRPDHQLHDAAARGAGRLERSLGERRHPRRAGLSRERRHQRLWRGALPAAAGARRRVLRGGRARHLSGARLSHPRRRSHRLRAAGRAVRGATCPRRLGSQRHRDRRYLSDERDTPVRSAVLALAAVIAVIVVLRVGLAQVPLERDEGEFAYMGQLILRGETPYVAAANMKLPGTYYAYAGILRAFGETAVAIRMGLLLVNLLAILLVYRLGALLLDPVAGAAAASAYAVLSIDPSVLGFTAKGEHFVVPPVLGALVLLARREAPRARSTLVAAGVLLGIAVLMKQHAGIFVVAAALWVLWTERGRGLGSALAAAIVLAAAAALPFLLVCAAMAAAGGFQPFWFWTIRYAREYATLLPLSVGLSQ